MRRSTAVISPLFTVFFLLLTPWSLANDISPAGDLPGWGPFEIKTQSPIQSLRYAAKMRDPRRQVEDSSSVWGYINLASIWTQSEQYEMDYYTFEYEAGWHYQWPSYWKTELSYSQRNTNDAHLDQLSLSFHKVFGIDQNNRDLVPKHRYVYSFPEFGINVSGFKNQVFSRAIALYIGRNLLESEQQSLSLGGVLHYETENRHQGWDYSAQADYYYSWHTRHQTYVSLAYSRFHSKNFFALPMKEHLVTVGLGYEYLPQPNRSIVIQYLHNEGATIGLDQLGKPSHEILMGYRWKFSHSSLELAAIENVINADNSADISFSIMYQYQLK